MDVVPAIVAPVAKALTDHITQKLRYFTSSADLVEEMGKQMKVLEGQRADNIKKMRRNRESRLETPTRVPEWLDEVKNIKKEVDKILPGRVDSKCLASTSTSDVEDVQEGSDKFPSVNIGCFDVKKKYRAGRDALRLTKDIERLIKESRDIIWRDAEIPLGRVYSKRLASTSSGGTKNLFKSRDKTFNDALDLLRQDDDKNRVIALCGMGGVGKTTLMNQLKEAAEDNKIFKWILVAVIGNTPNLFAIQQAIAAHIGKPLTETDETLRATHLSKIFKGFAEHKEKILLILDDVWEKIKLEDIGLASPLQDGVKLLLTSRSVNICQQIAVDADSVLEVVKVNVLEEGEARDFFSKIAGISAEHDHHLSQIVCDIVKKCGRLPLAIKLIAATLRGQQNFGVWRGALKRLKNNDLDENVQEIIKISYESLVQDDKLIFLLCGLFPEDSNIPIEDLTRYACGLKLLKQVSTVEDARDSIQTKVSNLKNSYLLMDGDSHHTECVKMHDLVLAFVVGTVSKGGEDGCWIIHHDDFSKSSEDVNISQSCKQISLTCKGMSEFPSEFKLPNLSLLKLMHGNEPLRFPLDFYEGMQKLQVIAFQKLEYPVVPTSFQFSTNLRTLCLDACSLMFDLTCIGNILNLEVLSFINSGITIIPSTFRNLKKLRLLDVTGCYNLVIEDGVLKNMVKLEELYMIAFDIKACCFTDKNFNELAERSEHLSALEFEFIGNNAHLKSMSFEKLHRFKLSVGCYYSEVKYYLETYQVDMHLYQNSLKLITNREELLTSKINQLFKMTDALYLQVNDMNTLEDVDVESPHPRHNPRKSTFYNLRFLVVSGCVKLKYLFTMNVATSLSKLEYLDISRCPIMEAVIHTENDESDIIKFSNLKYLKLAELPKLLCFRNNVNVIELPRLTELRMRGLQNPTSIYASSASSSVSRNISGVQSFFQKEVATPKLEELFVSNMENLKEIWSPQFHIGKLEQRSSSLRCIEVSECDSLVQLFPCNPYPFLKNLQELKVKCCGSIEVLFDIDLGYAGKFEKHVCSSSLRSIEVSRCVWLVKLFSCNPNPFMNNLQELKIESCYSIQVLFATDLGHAGKIEERVCNSSLRSIKVRECERLVNLLPRNPLPLFNNLEELEVKDCACIEVLFDIDMGSVGEIEELACSSNLRIIQVYNCNSLVKLFSCNPFPFFNNLQELKVESCRSIQLLFNTDLGRAGKIEEQVCNSSLRSIKVSKCNRLVNLLPRNPLPLFNHLEELKVTLCDSVEVIFDIDMSFVGETDKVSSSSKLRSIHLMDLGKLREVWRIKDAGNNLIHGFEAVESIRIQECLRFENLITPATTSFDLRALKQVEITSCGRERDRIYKWNKVISSSREEVLDDISKVALPSYLLHTCHHVRHLDLVFYKAVEVVFEIMSPSSRESAHNQQQLILPYLEALKLHSLERMSHVWKCNWNEILILQKQVSQSSFNNLTTIEMSYCHSIKYLFSPLMAKLLSNLKKVYISTCDDIEEVVSNRDDEDSSMYSHTTTTFFPHLHILELMYLANLKCIHDQLKLSQASWSFCQYAREISINNCGALSSVIPWYAVGQMHKLQVLKISECKSLTEVFETQEINKGSTGKSLPRLDYITMLKLPKLKILKIQWCRRLEYIFTFSTLESLMELEELEIKDCESMEAIVNKESGDQKVVFPHLKSLILVNLPNFVGFFLGKNEFTWTTLEKVVISECPQVTVFTYGQSTAPKLKFISTSLGKHSVECGLNFHVTTTSHQIRLPSYEGTSSYRPTTMERFPWSYHNLIEMDLKINPSGGESLFSSDKLLQLQKLETVRFEGCEDTEEIFDSQTVAEIPNLRQMDFKDLSSLKYIWKSKQGTVLKFPNLTRLSLEKCPNLEYVFTCSMVGSILQLQELHISYCDSMKVIVKGEEESDAIENDMEFPCLKSLKLNCVKSLEGFYLGKEAFEFPSLHTLHIDTCENMTVFTMGDLSAPKLYAITKWWGGKFNIHNRLNSVIKNFTSSRSEAIPRDNNSKSYNSYASHLPRFLFTSRIFNDEICFQELHNSTEVQLVCSPERYA